jgi:hypothetical protein
MKPTALCIAAAAAATAVLGPVPALAGQTTEARANQLPLRFKDANGKVVGRAAWGNVYANAFIIMEEGKQIFAIGAYGPDPRQLYFRGDVVHYKTADCSGQAYLDQDPENTLQGLRFATVLSSGDGKLSILVAEGIRDYFNVESYRYNNSCFVNSYPIFGVPVTDTIDITGKYQPPFSIR